MEIKMSDFNKKAAAFEMKRNKAEKMLLDQVSSYYDSLIASIPTEILKKPLNKLTMEDIIYLRKDDSTESSIGLNEARDGISDLEPPPKFRKPSTRSSRALKTPAQTMRTPASAMVTPKFNPQSTMSVLRKPKEGEIAMSMSGSPLHVTSVINESKPNVVVPLKDGKILSVLPERGLRKSEIPLIDPSLRRQLKVLNENLAAILSLNE